MLKTPLKYARVSSGFDRKRMHPILHIQRAHLGVDYAAPVGTPVWATAGGSVSFVGPRGGAGNAVILSHAGGMESIYMHLSKFASGQKIGDHVDAKTVIGYVGMTGLATGPHLHFGVLVDGVHVDPLKMSPSRGRGIGGKDVTAFKNEVGSRLGKMQAIVIQAPSAPVADDDDASSAAPASPLGGDADADGDVTN